VKTTVAALAVVLLLALGAGCGADTSSTANGSTANRACPSAWRAGWQRLANRVGTTVYCPRWVPSPLTAQIGGRWSTGVSVGKRDHSYLAGFIWFEKGSEVHVNFRGYPGRVTVPTCVNEEQVGKKLVRSKVPCFADPHGTQRIGPFRVTLYTVNRDADQWHLLYLFRHAGSLYAVSEHVAPPFGYQRVLRNLGRMVRGLVPIRPTS
jgi:hypothetical protein